MVQSLAGKLSLLKFYLGEHNCIIVVIYTVDKNMTAEITIFTQAKKYLKISLNIIFFEIKVSMIIAGLSTD